MLNHLGDYERRYINPSRYCCYCYYYYYYYHSHTAATQQGRAPSRAVPFAVSDGEMPVRSCSGRALSRGMSSGTRARGWPRTTAAARHTCLMRGPPARRNSWHSGDTIWGWEGERQIRESLSHAASCVTTSGTDIEDAAEKSCDHLFTFCLASLPGSRVLTCPWGGSVLTGTWSSGGSFRFLRRLLEVTSLDEAPDGPDSSYSVGRQTTA